MKLSALYMASRYIAMVDKDLCVKCEIDKHKCYTVLHVQPPSMQIIVITCIMNFCVIYRVIQNKKLPNFLLKTFLFLQSKLEHNVTCSCDCEGQSERYLPVTFSLHRRLLWV